MTTASGASRRAMDIVGIEEYNSRDESRRAMSESVRGAMWLASRTKRAATRWSFARLRQGTLRVNLRKRFRSPASRTRNEGGDQLSTDHRTARIAVAI